MVDVSFVGGGTAPIVTGATANWNGPPAGPPPWTPTSGRLGGLFEASRPGGTLDGYLGDLNTVATKLHDAVNTAYGSDFFQLGSPAAGTLELDPGLRANPSLIDGGTGAEGSNDVALAIAALQNDPITDINGSYHAFVAKVGSHVRESIRQEANAQVLTDAVENRRQSVAGVSMDEEMSNLVRFQRSYQASSRAMSTMDEMLDVLINRTGRVGL